MITDATSPAAFASTEASHAANPQLKALLTDYAMALPPQLRRSTLAALDIDGHGA